MTYMWGRGFHVPLPICFLGFANRMEMLRVTAKPKPLLSVGPRYLPSWCLAQPRSSTLWWEQWPRPDPTGALHTQKGYFSSVSIPGPAKEAMKRWKRNWNTRNTSIHWGSPFAPSFLAVERPPPVRHSSSGSLLVLFHHLSYRTFWERPSYSCNLQRNDRWMWRKGKHTAPSPSGLVWLQVKQSSLHMSFGKEYTPTVSVSCLSFFLLFIFLAKGATPVPKRKKGIKK